MRYFIYILICLVLLFNNLVLAGNNSGAAFSTWPDTGQTNCYDNTQEIECPSEEQPFHGQAAQYNGPAPSYTLLDGGTMVKDNATGLVWEQKTNMDNVANYDDPHDADNLYNWCDSNPDTNGGNQGTCNWNNTQGFINQLNNARFGGYDDWRLPTIKELATLIDRSRYNPAIAPVFAETTQFEYYSPWYWSSTTTITSYANGLGAWTVAFNSGAIVGDGKSIGYYARAVRGGATQPTDRFVDNGDETITDTANCLQWQKTTMDVNNDGVPDGLNWQSALEEAENLVLAGKDDWRLPDNKELLSLVDYSRYNPAINPIFTKTYLDRYWSSDTLIPFNDAAWKVEFKGGGSLSEGKILGTRGFVRAVRGKQCGGLGILGDINKDGLVNLLDSILVLQVISGIVPIDTVATDNEVNSDGKIGLAEAINALRKTASISE